MEREGLALFLQGAIKSLEVENDKLLGDIIISIETAQRQADTLNHGMEKELTVLLIHGLLHLTGYDHEKDKDYKIMREKKSEMLIRFACYLLTLTSFRG